MIVVVAGPEAYQSRPYMTAKTNKPIGSDTNGKINSDEPRSA